MKSRGTRAGLTRREILTVGGLSVATVAVGHGLTGCGREPTGPAHDGHVQTLRYGSDASQFVELTLPESATGPVPVAVVIHGGFWRSAYGLELGRPLAGTLPGQGWAALNIEYRRVGNGGGYPATLIDVALAIDLLADAGQAAARDSDLELDLETVVTIGHSAGGHLAAWAATRTGQDAGSPGAAPRVGVSAVVSQAGVLDLRACAREGLGDGAAQAFLAGGPDDVPDRYEQASPIEWLPLGVPTLCVHASQDANVPISQSEDFVAAALAAGDDAELVTVEGDHFVVIDPEHPSWSLVLDWLDRVVG
ncbi:MAG: prolyl oligopeptidase family serine peptidase [Geodermatophilaceae bacterium]|nr:prolyl oligopeptidase family serine peptidase [Geodermatophilaceae bacterium]